MTAAVTALHDFKGGWMRAELDKVIGAVKEFYARESHLLEKDRGERTLTHRLAVHLERQFDGWDVDCDYNRLGERVLKLPHGSIVSTDDELGKSVFPDIVVHRRRSYQRAERQFARSLSHLSNSRFWRANCFEM